MKTKTTLVLAGLILIFYCTRAQINVGGIIKDKVNQLAEQKVGEGVDKGLDETEKGVKYSAKKKDKDKKKQPNNDSNSDNSQENNSNSNTNSNPGSCPNNAAPAQQADMKSYSKFDFVPGEQVIYFEDFHKMVSVISRINGIPILQVRLLPLAA